MKCPLRYCQLRYKFLVRSLNNSEVQNFYLSKGHWYSTRIMSRLSTVLRLIWYYLRVKIFMSTPLPFTQKNTKNVKWIIKLTIITKPFRCDIAKSLSFFWSENIEKFNEQIMVVVLSEIAELWRRLVKLITEIKTSFFFW